MTRTFLEHYICVMSLFYRIWNNSMRRWPYRVKKSVPIPTMAIIAMLVVLGFVGEARAAALYWDSDGLTAANNAVTGANLGGSGIWNLANSNWWDTAFATPIAWTDGSDAVFWG